MTKYNKVLMAVDLSEVVAEERAHDTGLVGFIPALEFASKRSSRGRSGRQWRECQCG